MNQPPCLDNVHERWLRRRLNYASIRQAGRHAPAPFLHFMTHHGHTKRGVLNVLKAKMFHTSAQRAASKSLSIFMWPEEVHEILDHRFMQHPGEKYCLARGGKLAKQETYETVNLLSVSADNIYSPSFSSIITGASWEGKAGMENCMYPHQHETPLTWTLQNDDVPKDYACPEF